MRGGRLRALSDRRECLATRRSERRAKSRAAVFRVGSSLPYVAAGPISVNRSAMPRCRLCSGSRHWPPAFELTLTGTKRSLGAATGRELSGGCTRHCGRRTPALWLAARHRPLPFRLVLRYRPNAARQVSPKEPDAWTDLFRASPPRSSRSWPLGPRQKRPSAAQPIAVILWNEIATLSTPRGRHGIDILPVDVAAAT